MCRARARSRSVAQRGLASLGVSYAGDSIRRNMEEEKADVQVWLTAVVVQQAMAKERWQDYIWLDAASSCCTTVPMFVYLR